MAKGVEQRVVIEVDVGMRRCGVPAGEAVVELARTIRRAPGLKFAGMMGWEAPCARLTDPAEKRACVEEALGGLTCTANLCRQADIPVEIVSCGGTGTYWVGAAIPGVTELQAGGGIFHDVHYADYFGVGHQFAMTVMTTVISRPTPTRIVVDAGRKTMSTEEANPRPLGVGEVESLSFSAEHGRIELAGPNTDLKVGDKVEWIVGNSDTTVLLHDKLYVTRDEMVEVVWPILGRDKLR